MVEPAPSSFSFRRTQSCRVPQRMRRAFFSSPIMQAANIRRAKFDRAFTVQDDEPSCSRKTGQNGSIRKTARYPARSRSQRRGTLGSIASLSFSQKQALTTSWRLLRPQAAGFFRKILLELEIVSNTVKQIFYKAQFVDAFNKDEENIATMDAHIKLMVKFFDDILASLDDETECVERMKRIGSCHAVLVRSCGFSSDIWERLGEISMERICAHEIVQKTREASRAWRVLLACIIDELRCGFDGEARYHRKTSSAEHLDVLDQVDDGETGNDGVDIQEKMRQLRMEYDSTVPYE